MDGPKKGEETIYVYNFLMLVPTRLDREDSEMSNSQKSSCKDKNTFFLFVLGVVLRA